MSNAQQPSNLNRASTERGVIDCEKCHAPIIVNQPNSVSVEFSVPCNKCGHRGIYFKRMLATPDRRSTPRD